MLNFMKDRLRPAVNKIIAYLHKQKAKKLNMEFFQPNYIYFDRLNPSSTIIDIGCAGDADLSVYMINKYGLKSFGIDPTLKHGESLSVLAEKTNGRFQYLPYAVSAKDGRIVFHESCDNVSGSIRKDHINIKNDSVRSYEVESVTLKTLLNRLGLGHVAFMKMDLEGAEYDVINNTEPETYGSFDQILIEFHHHCMDNYSDNDTKDAVKTVESNGFISVSVDGRNYLFYRDSMTSREE